MARGYHVRTELATVHRRYAPSREPRWKYPCAERMQQALTGSWPSRRAADGDRPGARAGAGRPGRTTAASGCGRPSATGVSGRRRRPDCAGDPDCRGQPGDAARQRAGARRRDGLLRVPAGSALRIAGGSRRRSEACGRRRRPGRLRCGAAILLGDLCLIWCDEMLHSSGFDAGRAGPGQTVVRARAGRGDGRPVPRPGCAGHAAEPAWTVRCEVLRYKAAKYTVERPLHIGGLLAGGRTPADRDASRRTGCRWVRRSSCATTCSGCSATRR